MGKYLGLRITKRGMRPPFSNLKIDVKKWFLERGKFVSFLAMKNIEL